MLPLRPANGRREGEGRGGLWATTWVTLWRCRFIAHCSLLIAHCQSRAALMSPSPPSEGGEGRGEEGTLPIPVASKAEIESAFRKTFNAQRPTFNVQQEAETLPLPSDGRGRNATPVST